MSSKLSILHDSAGEMIPNEDSGHCADDIFKFLTESVCIQISMKFVFRVQLRIKSAIFGYDKSYLNQSWSIPYRIYAPSGLNSLRLSDAYIRNQATSHYLNRCWHTLHSKLKNKFQWDLKRISYILIQENAFEDVVYQSGGHLVPTSMC